MHLSVQKYTLSAMDIDILPAHALLAPSLYALFVYTLYSDAVVSRVHAHASDIGRAGQSMPQLSLSNRAWRGFKRGRRMLMNNDTLTG